MRHRTSTRGGKTRRLPRVLKRWLSFQKLESRAMFTADYGAWESSYFDFHNDDYEDFDFDWAGEVYDSNEDFRTRSSPFSEDCSFLDAGVDELSDADIESFAEFRSWDRYDESWDRDMPLFDDFADDQMTQDFESWDRSFEASIDDRKSSPLKQSNALVSTPTILASHLPDLATHDEVPQAASTLSFLFAVVNAPSNDHAAVTNDSSSVQHVASTPRSTSDTVPHPATSTGVTNRAERSVPTSARGSVSPQSPSGGVVSGIVSENQVATDASKPESLAEPSAASQSNLSELDVSDQKALPFGMKGMIPVAQDSQATMQVEQVDAVVMTEYLWLFRGDAESEASLSPENSNAFNDSDSEDLNASQSQMRNSAFRARGVQVSGVIGSRTEGASPADDHPWPEGMLALDINAPMNDDAPMLAASLDPMALIQMFVRAGEPVNDHLASFAAIDAADGPGSEPIAVNRWMRWFKDPKVATLASIAMGVVAVMTARRSPQTSEVVRTVKLR
jgi:hypothetical protein